jgi:hypothetical protein
VTEEWFRRIIRAAVESFPIDGKKKDELLRKLLERFCREGKGKR